MLGRKGIALRQAVKAQGSVAVAQKLTESLREGTLKPENFSLLELAYGFMGEDFLAEMSQQETGHNVSEGIRLMQESGSGPSGVDSTAFIDITGQIVYNKIMDAYNAPEFVADNFVEVVPTSFLDGEKIAGITAVKGQVKNVAEGSPYPEAAIGQDYIETPATTKQGLILSLTKETIAKDRTGVLLTRAANIGQRSRMDKENRIWDVVLGNVNNYKWKGTTYNTFLSSSNSATTWLNDGSGAPFTDWTSIEEVMVKAADIVNPDQPDYNEPLPVADTFNTLLAMPSNFMKVKRVLGATQIRGQSGGSNVNWTIGDNVVNGMFTPYISSIAYQRLIQTGGITASNAKDYWFLGNPKKAFYYMEVWPIQVFQAPENSEPAFTRDIVTRWKISERGVAVVANPRYWFRRYNS